MKNGLRTLLPLILLIAPLGMGHVARALNPSLPPGGNFDLSHWKLQLPTLNGVLTATNTGTDSTSAASLVGGFTNAYFYTGTDGAMIFWAPDNGARTSGSTHPRSELREQLIPGNDNTNWTLRGTHILTATCVVSNVPNDTGKVCIGQMHQPTTKPGGGASTGNEHMIMFDFNNKKIYVNVSPDGNSSDDFSLTFISGSSNVKLGVPINYTLSIVDGVLKIIINNVTNSWNLFSGTNYSGQTFSNWDVASGNTLYFKAGAYNQTTNQCNCSTDGARVAFYDLTIYHAANITNQPASQSVGAGSNVMFTVAASGNGKLGYQWRFNATNLLAGATNAALVLTNVSGANAGDYSVVVSDSTSSFQSVTSALATLTVIGGVPPMTSDPADQTVVTGGSAIFSVAATGSSPLAYQWQKGGVNLTNGPILSGATSNQLMISAVSTNNVGHYRVVITNSFGSVTSMVASLTITNTSPTFTSNPVKKPGTTVGLAYSNSLAGDATDPDGGDILIFNKVNGPMWLSVAGNGTLSGTPGAGDVGTNSWTVSVTDLASASNQATLKIIVTAVPTGGTVTNLIVDDSFADGSRTNTGPLQADWWSSSSTSGNSVEMAPGALGLISGTSGRGIHATFAPQTLGVGDTITATFTFTTPVTIGSTSGSFRVALMDFNNAGLAADLSSSSSSTNPLYVNLPGYFADFDVNTGAAADIGIREHNQPADTGRFLGTATEWTAIGDSPDAGYVFAPNMEYVGVLSITRTGADSVDIFSSMSQGATLMDSHAESDKNAIANNFGMLGFWVNSNTFGNNTTPGDPNNGITFSNVKVEAKTVTTPTVAPTLVVSLTGTNILLAWPTNDSAGFNLESTTSLTSPSWMPAGTPTVVADQNHITNSATGNAMFFRLKKP